MTTKITDKNISSIANLFVSWQSVITADGSTTTTGVAGRGYFINTTSAAHTFILPTIATAGDTILIKDYAGTFASNKLTIDRNGHNIQGVANNSLIGTNRASVTLVYIDGTRGWEFVKESNVADLQQVLFVTATGGTLTTSGDFKIHSFTGDGSFVVSCAGNSVGSNKVDYLVIAGGGGSGGGGAGYNFTSGGGGAGGYRTTFPSPGCNAGSFPITATTFPITVGGGGVGGSINSNENGTQGSPSIFSTITSAGGGGGGSQSTGGVPDGGSGGGLGGFTGPNGRGGLGNSPPVSPPQGNNGGDSPFVQAGGGGGGIGGAGGNATGAPGACQPGSAGSGGAGVANSITGSPVSYAGGGAGTGSVANGSPGGSGGGAVGSNGTDNTGGGAGGATNRPSGGKTGGKGIVVIRYKFQ